MKYYKHNGEVFAIDEGQDHLVKEEWTKITEAAAMKAVAPTSEELLEDEMNGCLASLASTDWYISRKVETGIEVPADILTERQSCRVRIDEIREILGS